MIKVHRPDGQEPVEFPDCSAWTHDVPSGSFTVKKGAVPMAVFAPGQWTWAEDATRSTTVAGDSA